MKINTYAVNCNDAWLNSEGHDISGSYVKYKDHQGVVAALEAKCAALAAENAGLKNQLRELFNSCDTGERRGNGSLSGAAVPDWCVLEKTRQFLESTPATDAFLAEVRAQGVEMAIEHIEQTICPNHEMILSEFADRIRKGVQS